MVLLGALIALVGPARAQTDGYPGPTSPPAVRGSSETREEPPLRPGDSTVLEDCGFSPGSTARISVNGGDAGTRVTDADGCVRVPVKVLASGAGCAELEVNGRRFEARPGRNEVVVEGTGSNGQPRTFTNILTVSCSTAAPLPTTGSSLLGWARVGLLLMAVGTVAVLWERRRLARRVG